MSLCKWQHYLLCRFTFVVVCTRMLFYMATSLLAYYRRVYKKPTIEGCKRKSPIWILALINNQYKAIS